MLVGACVAAAVLFVAAAASGAEYKDTAGAFTISYDDTVWSIAPGADDEFSIACKLGACEGIVVGCSGSRLWVPLASVSRLTREFDTKTTEATVLDGLAREQAARDKTAPDTEIVPPEVVKSYTLNYRRDGHPFYDSDYRASLSGQMTRFLSFSTAARSYSIAIVCHVPESRLSVWRPRIDALVEGFKPEPDPFWLRWLAVLGL